MARFSLGSMPNPPSSASLEASPVPKFEWSGLARVLDSEQLADVMRVVQERGYGAKRGAG